VSSATSNFRYSHARELRLSCLGKCPSWVGPFSLKHQLDAPSPMAISRSPRVSSVPGNGVLHRRLSLSAHPTHGKAYQRESSVLLGSISLPVSSAMEHWSATRVRSTDPFIVSTVAVLPGPLFIRPCGRRTNILPFDRASRGNVDNPSPRLRAKTAPTEQPIRFPLLYLTCKRKLNWPLSRSSEFFPMQHDKSS
jgi:hypothetical protein